MNAYHEAEVTRLSDHAVYFIKNIVDKPIPMTHLHWHNSYEILYVRRGFGEQQINAEKFRYIPGSVTVLVPGDIHTTVSESQDGSEIDVLHFIGSYFGSNEDGLRDLKSMYLDKAHEEIPGLFDKICQYTYSTERSESLILSGAVSMLCGILAEQCRSTEETAGKTDFALHVCRYLRDAVDIRLEDVSHFFGYSPEHFSRKFHAELGVSFQHYRERILMQRSLDFFDNPNISLGEIAEILGYSDASSFIRAFKRIYGITPGNYRRMRNPSR